MPRFRLPRLTFDPWRTFAIIGTGLLATSVAAWVVFRTAALEDRTRFERIVDRARANVADRASTYVAMLRGGAALFAAAPELGPAEFRAYVSRLELRADYPGIQGIGFTRRIRAQDGAAVVRRMHEQGMPTFSIWPAGPRAEYHAILFLEPLDRRNRAAIGYDMSTEPVRRAAMARARDTGEPAASGRVTLVQEIDEEKQPGFLIYVPVYEGATPPTTVDGRRAALIGFVYAPFRVTDLFRAIFGPADDPYIRMEVYEGATESPAALLHRVGDDGPSTPRLVGSRQLDVAGQAWTLVARSRPGFERQSHQRHVPLVLVGGIGLSLIAALIDRLLARARHAQARLSDMRDAVRRGERMHQLAVEQVSDHAIFRVDPDGRLASWNRGVERVLGWRSADFIGQPYAAIFTPEDAGDDLPDRELRAARTGEVTSTERWHLRHDGTRLRAAVTTTTLTDRQDRFAGLLVVMRDITERALAEERFRTLVDDAPVLVWRSDVTGACTWFNKQWLAFTGRSMEQELGGGWAASVHPGDLDRCLRTHQAALSAREPFSMEYRLRRHDGEWRWIVDNGQPVFSGPSRELIGFIGSCVDVHESRAAATALAEQRRTLLEVERSARQEAERVGRMKDEFLATLSHELRTPLNAMLGWAQLLVRGAARPEETQRGLDVIVRNARAQAQIIEDLLDMSRIVSGKVRLEMERVDLAAVVEAALDVVRPAAEARGVALRTSLPQGLPPVDADPHRLQQVLWNLLTNAVKFTPRDGEVRVSLVGEDDTIALRVTDTGQGIDPEFLPHVFERFRQADASITRQHGGLGLGLAIVRSIVEMHGGSIAAESGGADRGATFVARLPIARSAAPAGPRSRPVEGKVRETAGHRLRGVSVLVVDDDPDGRELTRIGLERDGALVRLAGSATEALQVLRGEAPAPDIVVSDLAMPAMGGFEFGRAVRELPGSRVSRVPLIALTALASPDHRARAIAAGFDAYVTKPLDREALVQVVAALAGAPAAD